MGNDQNKIMVKLFNKGLRIINTGSEQILPNSVSEVTKEESKKLLKLYDRDIVIVADGEDPTKAADNDSALCASLKKEVKFLKSKIKDLEKSDNAEVVEALQKDIENLGQELKKANAQILKLKKK